MDPKMGQEALRSTKMATRELAKTKNATKQTPEGPKRRPRELPRDENGTDAPLFGVSGCPQTESKFYIYRSIIFFENIKK